MKKHIFLSLAVLASLYAENITLDNIEIDATVLNDVAENAKVSADLGEVLSKDVPSIDMVRRSGIANDIIMRGQKRDNISVTIDGTKVYGACPNRMDPPVSHVLSNNVETIEVIDGPYDVTEYGTIAGGVKITTKSPQKGFHGDVSFGGGSWGYKKLSASFDGGTDRLRMLVAGSTEESDQYKDGDGNTLAEQVDLKAPKYAYLPQYHDMKAYTKKSFMTKIFLKTLENQELRASYTANRSDGVMYPNSKMDAYYDDSDIYDVEYEIKNIASWYKSAILEYYKTEVDHPMGIKYRITSKMMGDKINHMWSSMEATRLKNRFDLAGINTEFGLEAGKRNWDGEYTVNGIFKGTSIDDVDTKNYSAYLKLDKKIANFDLSGGVRYDRSEIRPDAPDLIDRDFDSVSANIFTNYHLDQANKIFLGIAQAQRVPDARELYFRMSGKVIGTQDLEQVTNHEIDLGYKYEGDNADIKIKTFYSMLSDYIYVNAQKMTSMMENIDATIYGAEFSGTLYLSDTFSLEAMASYKKGEKDEPLAGQTDTDLADITPLEGKIGIVYDYAPRSYARLDVTMRDKWDTIDSDNGEQELDSWSVLDFKAKHSFNRNIDLTVGVNNILDKTYVRSNTYVDLTLVTTGTGEKMVLNEPGRYFYASFDLHF
ncbi:MAG: TonB-dependent receptor [Epsilonproteobacteria bacterium]|nr:TonB-dependent receptor [Campylobacterota bacterium]